MLVQFFIDATYAYYITTKYVLKCNVILKKYSTIKLLHSIVIYNCKS